MHAGSHVVAIILGDVRGGDGTRLRVGSLDTIFLSVRAEIASGCTLASMLSSSSLPPALGCAPTPGVTARDACAFD
jgi:hypothetical protein